MFARLAQFALAALALTIGNHANAQALTYGTYYDETVATPSCPSSNACRVNFSQLPADKLLMVQKINCSMASTQLITGASLNISATSGGTSLSRFLPMAVPPSQALSGGYFTNFREDTHFLVGQGRFPFVIIFASASSAWDVRCTLIGELVTPL